MLDGIVKVVRSKSREEWQGWLQEKYAGVRSYVRENGEKAAVIGFLLGICIVTFYKLVIFLCCLAVVCYQLVLILSDSRRTE